jgi:thiamine-phosphate pyrophosphorylase
VSEKPSCRLYLISPPAIDLSKFESQLKEALSGGDVGSFQLRLKNASDDDILTAARRLLPICHEHEVAFILNDRADLAVKCNADGIHLGQDDMPVKEARRILGEDRIIGVSAHASKHLAMVAGEQGADYVAFGAFYSTTSKPAGKVEKWGVPTPDILTWWQEYMILPCVAIGGINPGNLAPLVRAGADFIAAITAVWDHKSGPAQAVKEFNQAIKQATGKRE